MFLVCFFFFNDTATTEIYTYGHTLSLHDALPISVIWYTAMFSGLSFLKGPMKVDDTAAEIIVGVAAALGMGFFVIAGKLSDRIGRKKRSEEHTSELQSLMRISYAVFCLKKKKTHN